MVWSSKLSNLRIPARPVSYVDEVLPRSMNQKMNELLLKWIADLGQYARCEPIHFALMQQANNQMQIDGGTSSGIRVGDQLLIIDRDTIPQRSMEPECFGRNCLLFKSLKRSGITQPSSLLLGLPCSRLVVEWHYRFSRN